MFPAIRLVRNRARLEAVVHSRSMVTTEERSRVVSVAVEQAEWRRAGRGAVALVLALVVAGCSAVAQAQVPKAEPSAGGHLLLIGGGYRPPEVMARFIELAGGAERPLVVFPMASEDSRKVGEEQKAQLEAQGAKQVQVVHVDDRGDALRPETLEAVRRAGGVFFTGGDQNRISQRLVDTPLLQAIRELLARGGVVGGTSAGAACQSEIMFVGEGDEGVIRAVNIVTTRGIGLFPGVIVDSHFVARKRANRLVSLVLDHPELLGVGIDEATAVWVKPDRTLEVLGKGWVVLYDASQAKPVRTADNRLAVTGLVQHVLIDGQRFHLQRRAVLP
jgi:cyanophycinase